jgi:hypothetical protein
MLEKELRVLHLGPKADRRKLFSRQLGGRKLKVPLTHPTPTLTLGTVTQFFQQGHTYSNTYSYLLIVPYSLGQAYSNHHIPLPDPIGLFKHMSLWWPYLAIA